MLTGLQTGDEVVSKRHAPAPPAHAASPAKRGLLASLALLVVGAIVVYSLLPDGARDAVNDVASHAGVVGHAVPWVERADTALHRMFDGSTGAVVARSIQRVTHFSGENASLQEYSVRRMGDRVSVRISVNWHGGFTGDGYTTIVAWEFSESGHISVTLLGDDAPTPVTDSNMRELDIWFRAELFPVLRSNAG